MSSNPFATEAAWEVADTILPAGDHVVEIMEIDGTGDSRNGYPQIEVRASNADGSIRDWIVVIPETIGRVVQLTDAAGLERPGDDDVTEEGKGYRISQAYLNRALGQKVGVVIREEPDYNEPDRMRSKVKGWVPKARIQTPSDVTPASAGDAFSSAPAADEDIPF